MNKTSNYVFATIGAIVTAIFVALVFGFIGAAIVLWLWNIIIIPVFHAPVLTYWQVYGLISLIRLVLPTSTKTVEKK